MAVKVIRAVLRLREMSPMASRSLRLGSRQSIAQRFPTWTSGLRSHSETTLLTPTEF
jgi:hypothetical protein